jgi:trimethylamine:corrinoid methyltransferase-like protein
MTVQTIRRVAAVGLMPLIASLALGSQAVTAAPSAVTDGKATAAVVGLVTRIPAEILGGVVYADTSVNLDKARARASGAYPGYLADAFLRSSAEEYGQANEEADAIAENPPQTAS